MYETKPNTGYQHKVIGGSKYFRVYPGLHISVTCYF